MSATPTVVLNGKQQRLLTLLCRAGSEGALVYGRGPTETVRALKDRGLVAAVWRRSVIQMDVLETREQWVLTPQGKAALGRLLFAALTPDGANQKLANHTMTLEEAEVFCAAWNASGVHLTRASLVGNRVVLR